MTEDLRGVPVDNDLDDRRADNLSRIPPPIGDPCELCGGEGKVEVEQVIEVECPRCHGRKVEP